MEIKLCVCFRGISFNTASDINQKTTLNWLGVLSDKEEVCQDSSPCRKEWSRLNCEAKSGLSGSLEIFAGFKTRRGKEDLTSLLVIQLLDEETLYQKVNYS